MTVMFVANCTKQVREFIFKIPEGGLRRQTIPIGQQIKVAGIDNDEQIKAIVEQYQRYGMMTVADAIKAKTFTGLIYSLDKPVKVENMEIVLSNNDAQLVKQGQQIRKEAAIAAANSADEHARSVGGELKATETTITEVPKNGGEPTIQEGVLVDKSAPAEEQHESGQSAKAKIKGGKR